MTRRARDAKPPRATRAPSVETTRRARIGRLDTTRTRHRHTSAAREPRAPRLEALAERELEHDERDREERERDGVRDEERAAAELRVAERSTQQTRHPMLSIYIARVARGRSSARKSWSVPRRCGRSSAESSSAAGGGVCVLKLHTYSLGPIHLVAELWEAPDVAKTDGRADRREDKRRA